MDESNLLVLAVTFLLGFLVFKKDTGAVSEDSNKERLKNNGASLRDNSGDLEPKLSGVSKYLNAKQGLNVDTDSIESSVTKYLANKEKSSLSGVSKYMVKQSLDAKKKAKENISGVEKYLNNKN